MDHIQIVVGVDGSASSWRALRWAAHQAEITGRSLLVAYMNETEEQLGNYGFGDRLAEDTVVALTRDHPSLLAHTIVISGDAAQFLLDASADAAMLVLGREQTQSSVTSLGPSTASVLARSERPCVVLGDLPTDERPGTTIVLGVSGSPSGAAAMHFACIEGVRACAPVLAVRSSLNPNWKLARAAPAPSSPEERDTDEQQILDDCLAEARKQFPSVVISGFLSKEAVRFALARASHR